MKLPGIGSAVSTLHYRFCRAYSVHIPVGPFGKSSDHAWANNVQDGGHKKKTMETTIMNKNNICRTVLWLVLTTVGFGTAVADDEVDKLVAHARAAAPAAISADATIVIGGEVVVEGSNGWTCLPDTMPGDGAALCIDAVWGEMMAALGAKAAFTASSVGISYMLLGEPAGSGVSNSDPYHEDPAHAHDYVETGPHLMVIVPKESMKGITDDPSSGGPYVMWKDTDYAHIMIPVGSRD
jgi:hypothetical protein